MRFNPSFTFDPANETAASLSVVIDTILSNIFSLLSSFWINVAILLAECDLANLRKNKTILLTLKLFEKN
jgi:hypothetical protein